MLRIRGVDWWGVECLTGIGEYQFSKMSILTSRLLRKVSSSENVRMWTTFSRFTPRIEQLKLGTCVQWWWTIQWSALQMGVLSLLSAVSHILVTLSICFRSAAISFDNCGRSYSKFMWYTVGQWDPRLLKIGSCFTLRAVLLKISMKIL